jgi:hypothetical protein
MEDITHWVVERVAKMVVTFLSHDASGARETTRIPGEAPEAAA